MALQWQDIQVQGGLPSFSRPVQYSQPLQIQTEAPIETTQNPWLTNRVFQRNSIPMSTSSFGQPFENKPSNLSSVNSKVSQFLTNARNNSIGAKYSQAQRMKQGYYDCSSLAARTLNQSGIAVNPNMTTATMPTDMKKAGFSMMAIDPNDLREGDILWKNGHTAIYAGNGTTIEARGTNKPVGEYNLFGRSGRMVIPYTHVFRREWS